jgi:hypothetical protein
VRNQPIAERYPDRSRTLQRDDSTEVPRRKEGSEGKAVDKEHIRKDLRAGVPK